MNLVDIHAHLDHKQFKDDIDEVIQRAKDAGVKAIVTSGVNKATNRKVLELAEKYDIVKASLGVYPIDALEEEFASGEADAFARDIEPLDVDAELKFIADNKDKIVAVGECGLDYAFFKNKPDVQKSMRETFQKVIDAVEKINKPIIVHTRKAELDCVEMLESSNLKNIILHCFMARKHLVKRAADNGWSFSVPPIVVRLEHFQMMADMVNISQLLTETDAPGLSPYPGQRNEPAFVIETIKKIAEIKKMDEKEVANNVYMNYQRLFE